MPWRPIALVEIQGYVYDAKLRMASLARRLGDAELAARLESEAAELYRRFDDAFWMADTSFYAIALDRDKRQVGTIGSNPGHCLWSGIVPPERVDAVVDRLLDPAMDCGWGIRTYAAGQPGYNPVGYHTGTVWPHDNALIAAGMKRAGRHDAADRVASRIFEAAQHSPDFRLPELFCGFDRGLADVPVPYPVACSPQAWSAATSLSLLQTMLGMHADAARDVLELDRPHLPAWLGKVTVHELRVGERIGGPAVPPLAREHDERRGPASGRSAGARDPRLKWPPARGPRSFRRLQRDVPGRVVVGRLHPARVCIGPNGPTNHS